MKKTSSISGVLLAVVGGLAFAFLCLFISFLVTSNTYKTQLENAYMRGFYEVVDNVNTLEVDLSKIVATTSIDSQRELLSDIYNNCMLGVSNMAVLPIENNEIIQITNLLNSAGGYAYSLLLNNYEGNSISSEQYHQIETIHDSVRSLQYDINEYMRKLQYDYSILEDIDFSSGEKSEFSGGLAGTESSSAEVPTLIYDGPFSNSVLNKEIKGLEDVFVEEGEARAILQEIYEGQDISFTGESLGKFETYNYEVGGDVTKYTSITKNGGLLLTVTSFGSGGGERCSVEKGVEIAQDFATSLGIDNMYSVWYQETGSVMYVNLAPIVDHVIYYSDLIKVKVDMCLQEVVGWEASSYATNHTSRTFTSSIGILDAQEKINDSLTVVERNLCIVPNDYIGESSAYEFICTWKDYTYYIYIDSNTGKELNILRVIETNNGNLLM